MAERVQGIGGVFFRSGAPSAVQEWYATNLGIAPMGDGPWGHDDPASLLRWRDARDPERMCHTVFAPFDEDTDHFEPSSSSFMLNLRVDDLDAMLAQLAANGVEQLGETVALPSGRFARILDPEHRVVELWEPADGF